MAQHRVGKFACFEDDKNGDRALVVWENGERSFGMRVYHYLWEPLTEQDVTEIRQTQERYERENAQATPEQQKYYIPFLSGLDPQVGKRYLVVMGGRMAFGPFDDLDHVQAQMESQGYEFVEGDDL